MVQHGVYVLGNGRYQEFLTFIPECPTGPLPTEEEFEDTIQSLWEKNPGFSSVLSGLKKLGFTEAKIPKVDLCELATRDMP